MGIFSLWQAILASAVGVWLLSALVWMVFPWHKSDFSRTGDEEAVRAALKGLAPGFYNVPHVMSPAELKDPEVEKKYADGPLAFVTIVASGVPQMGGKLIASFVYNLFVGMLAAYMVSRTASADAHYLEVFRIAGTTAFMAYGVAYIQDSIWFGRPVSITVKSLFDAFLYGLLTGGFFGWLA